jgi:hypothetical protein
VTSRGLRTWPLLRNGDKIQRKDTIFSRVQAGFESCLDSHSADTGENLARIPLREAHHNPATAEVGKAWSITSTSPQAFMELSLYKCGIRFRFAVHLMVFVAFGVEPVLLFVVFL